MITFHPLPITMSEELFRFEVVFFEDRIVEIIKLCQRVEINRCIYKKGQWLIRCTETNEDKVRRILAGDLKRRPGTNSMPERYYDYAQFFAKNDAEALKMLFSADYVSKHRMSDADVAAVMAYLSADNRLDRFGANRDESVIQSDCHV